MAVVQILVNRQNLHEWGELVASNPNIIIAKLTGLPISR